MLQTANTKIAEALAKEYARVYQEQIDKGKPVEEAEQIAAVSADEYFSTPRHEIVRNKIRNRSFGLYVIKNRSAPLKDEKNEIESLIRTLERKIVVDKSNLVLENAESPPDEDRIYELESRISSNTRVLERNQLRLSNIETELQNIRDFTGGKKRSKRYNKSNKKTQRRRRVRKTKTHRTRI